MVRMREGSLPIDTVQSLEKRSSKNYVFNIDGHRDGKTYL